MEKIEKKEGRVREGEGRRWGEGKDGREGRICFVRGDWERS